MKKLVIDTSSLIKNNKIIEILKDEYKIIFPITVIEELDNLKQNSKNEETKFKARRAIHSIINNEKFVSFDIDTSLDKAFNDAINDNIIVSCAKRNNASIITDDYNLKVKANMINVDVVELSVNAEFYDGFKSIILSEDEILDLPKLEKNIYECLINQYLVVKYKDNEDVYDIFKWSGEKYILTPKHKLRSMSFGDKLKPKDEYQQMAIDSIMSHTITAITGKAGTGKSLMSLVTAMDLVDRGKYETLVILFNPQPLKGVANMGYYKGDQIDKTLQSNIGNMLCSKLGSVYAIENLMLNNKLKLISMADIRGMEIRDTEILYITECQNTSREILKVCLSRASKNCKIILDGDFDTQIDNPYFEGDNNGLKGIIDLLKGNEMFGYVDLKNVHRSKISKLVEDL